MERPSAYIPMDRRQAILRHALLPDQTHGAALFADISGFTPLTERLLIDLGPQRGAEELTRHLNAVYDAIINQLHRHNGSVISFSGDAITCWFDADTGLRAVACALAMQEVMSQFTAVPTPSGDAVTLAMKTAVSAGPARRFLIGDPRVQLIDVLAGSTLARLVAAEHQAGKGEVVLDADTAAALGEQVAIRTWRTDETTGNRFAVLNRLTVSVVEKPWKAFPPGSFQENLSRPWLLPAVYERLRSGRGEFLAELRPAVALFLRFSGIDYDNDLSAGPKLNTFVRRVQHILARYESNLLQLTIGDKGSHLYAAFGAPLAHEDDAVRAVSAALELRDLAQSLEYIDSIRIGISQGRMRTGAYGGTMRRTYGVLGDAVNTAARLMQAADSGQILVSAVTHHATNDTFNWNRLLDVKVKGKTEPVAVYSVAGLARQKMIRLQEPKYALPLVGRKEELALIDEKIALALQGQGQIVSIIGEAGLGKSRLVAEAIRHAVMRGLTGYGGECQSYGIKTSYLVWQRIWRGLFGLEGERPLSEQIQTLTTHLELIDQKLVPRLPLMGSVLNLPIPDNDLTRSFDAKLRKTSLEALLVDCLRALSRHNPLLIVLEDCHWMDPLSHDLLSEIGRALADRPVLLILAARQPGSEKLDAMEINQLPYFTRIRLSEFSPSEAQELIRIKLTRRLGEENGIPQAFIDRITDRAEGNPFYIEELLNYLQDHGIDPRDRGALERLDWPASLHSLILSRIDQLTESQKSTIKIASVIGRLFEAAMLWGVYPQLGNEKQVKLDLDVLSRLDLTPLDTPEPELSYLFKNIVTQEVAYESLPYATRAMLHDLIGAYIERHVAESPDQYLGLLAHHYGRSQNEAKKKEFLLRAGEAAQANYANDAAMEYYRRVLPLLPPAEFVPVKVKQGQVLELVGQWEEAFASYQKALQTAVAHDDHRAQARCQTIIGELHRKQGAYDEAAKWLADAQQGFEALGDELGIGQTLHYSGSLAAQQGDFDAARELYERSLTIRRGLDDRPQIANLLNNLGIVARYQGDYAKARALHNEALAIRRELGDRRALAVSLNNLGNVALDQEDYDEARSRLEEALTIQREVGDRSYIANALNNLGNVARAQGDYETAASLYHESLAINRELGDKWALAYLLEDSGALAALGGYPERALRLVGAATALRKEIGAPRSPVEDEKLEQLLAPARQQLDTEIQTTQWQQGTAMSLSMAIDYALQNELD